MVEIRYDTLRSNNPENNASELKLADIIGSLSHALDLTEGQPKGHCVRCCWIGTNIGLSLGLKAEALSDLYFTLLLKDLGCSSNAARICELYITDDIAFKKDFKTIDGNIIRDVEFTNTCSIAAAAKVFQ